MGKDKMLRTAAKRISKIAKVKVQEKIKELTDAGSMQDLLSWITEFEERFLVKDKNENGK
jgi:hypothetical protein